MSDNFLTANDNELSSAIEKAYTRLDVCFHVDDDPHVVRVRGETGRQARKALERCRSNEDRLFRVVGNENCSRYFTQIRATYQTRQNEAVFGVCKASVNSEGRLVLWLEKDDTIRPLEDGSVHPMILVMRNQQDQKVYRFAEVSRESLKEWKSTSHCNNIVTMTDKAGRVFRRIITKEEFEHQLEQNPNTLIIEINGNGIVSEDVHP